MELCMRHISEKSFCNLRTDGKIIEANQEFRAFVMNKTEGIKKPTFKNNISGAEILNQV